MKKLSKYVLTCTMYFSQFSASHIEQRSTQEYKGKQFREEHCKGKVAYNQFLPSSL